MTETLSTDLTVTDARVDRAWLSNSEVEETFPMDPMSDAVAHVAMVQDDAFALAWDAYNDARYSEFWGLDLG